MSKFKKGDRVKVIYSANSGFKVGTETVITSIQSSGGVSPYYRTSLGNWQFFEQDLELLPKNKEMLVEDLERLDVEIEELVKEKELVHLRIAYLAEAKTETYDETEFKVYQTLKLVNSNISDIEKAKLIASLING